MTSKPRLCRCCGTASFSNQRRIWKASRQTKSSDRWLLRSKFPSEPHVAHTGIHRRARGTLRALAFWIYAALSIAPPDRTVVADPRMGVARLAGSNGIVGRTGVHWLAGGLVALTRISRTGT